MDNNFVKPLFMERMHPMQQGMTLPGHEDFLNQPAQAARMHAVGPAITQQMSSGIPEIPGPKSPEAIASERPSGMPTNPLTKGSMEAMRAHIQSMRQITEPTDEDRQRAFGMGLVKWAAHQAANPPQSPGGMGLDVATAGIAPAMDVYQQQLANQAQQNMQLYGAVREDERYEREQKAAMAKAAEDKRRYDETLAERKAYHEGMLSKKGKSEKDKEGDTSLKMNGKVYDISDYPSLSGVGEKNKLSKLLRESSQISSNIKDIQKEYSKFEELTKNDWANPASPYSGETTGKVKDVLGETFGIEHWKNERVARKALEAQLGNLAPKIERTLKGSAPGEAMLTRFEKQGLLPKVTDGPELIKSKLKRLEEEFAKASKAAKLSLKHGRIIVQSDLEDFEGTNESPDVRQEKIAEIRKQYNLGPEIEDEVISEHYGIK